MRRSVFPFSFYYTQVKRWEGLVSNKCSVCPCDGTQVARKLVIVEGELERTEERAELNER